MEKLNLNKIKIKLIFIEYILNYFSYTNQIDRKETKIITLSTETFWFLCRAELTPSWMRHSEQGTSFSGDT